VAGAVEEAAGADARRSERGRAGALRLSSR
jgi:hypothetical protein